MTETSATPPEIPVMPAPQKPPIAGKMPSTIAFAVGIVLFFLPFVDIQCNNMSLKKISGTELATGFQLDGIGPRNSLLDGLKNMGDATVKPSKTDKWDPNVYALSALALGAVGLLLSLSNMKAGGIGGVLTGALAAASLVGLWMDIRKQIRADVNIKDAGTGVNIAVEFTPWFYIAAVAFIAAAYFSYKRMKA